MRILEIIVFLRLRKFQIMIGRIKEINELQQCYQSNRSEFVIIYGRRRVGKTYLVHELFEKEFAFHYVGAHHLAKDKQLSNFARSLQTFSGSAFLPACKNWFDAFNFLQDYLTSLQTKTKKVVFFDEMPWIDTPKSEFVAALENFWNGWAMHQKDILFIASGSATSWMADKLIDNQGGLHNRITQKIYLRPFTLGEVESYLEAAGCSWDRYQILQCYMIFGGIPFYLSLLKPKQSLVHNVDTLFFAPNAAMRDEFSELYNALFSNADHYINIVRALNSKKEGLTRTEIAQMTNIQGSTLTKMLSNLCKCDFVTTYAHYGRTVKNVIYRLADFYTLFYFKYVENDLSKDENRWTHLIHTQQVVAWQGLTFELVCLQHLPQIKKGLGIAGVLTSASSWRSENAQIDLLIDRDDRIINLCEMKFSQEPYAISAEYANKIRMRSALFREATKCKKGLVNTFVTTYGILPGKNSSVAESELTMEVLFE